MNLFDFDSYSGNAKEELQQYAGICGFPDAETVIVNYGAAGICNGKFYEMSPKQCYRNSATLVLENKELSYCLGYAKHIIPVEHAWVCENNIRHYDPTWENNFNEIGSAYIEVVRLTQEELIEVLHKNNNIPPDIFNLVILEKIMPDLSWREMIFASAKHET